MHDLKKNILEPSKDSEILPIVVVINNISIVTSIFNKDYQH